MPKIFTEKDKENIRVKLQTVGMEMLKQRGYKNSPVEDIAKSAGIAKGTFYQFFPSKEQLYYEIIREIRDKNREEIDALVTEHPQLSRGELSEYLYKRYTQTKTVYHYFSTEELNIILRKLPRQADITVEESNVYAAAVFSQLAHVNPVYQVAVVVNLMNIMGAFSANLELRKGREETLRLLAETLANYILKE